MPDVGFIGSSKAEQSEVVLMELLQQVRDGFSFKAHQTTSNQVETARVGAAAV